MSGCQRLEMQACVSSLLLAKGELLPHDRRRIPQALFHVTLTRLGKKEMIDSRSSVIAVRVFLLRKRFPPQPAVHTTANQTMLKCNRSVLRTASRFCPSSRFTAAYLPVSTCSDFHLWLPPAVRLKRARVGFSGRCRLHVRLGTGFTAFSIQRTSAGASCYRVTKQTWHCSSPPVGTDEKPPQERDPITWPVVHLLYEFGSVSRFEVSYFDCNL